MYCKPNIVYGEFSSEEYEILKEKLKMAEKERDLKK